MSRWWQAVLRTWLLFRVRLQWFWVKRVDQNLALDSQERTERWMRIQRLQLELELYDRD